MSLELSGEYADVNQTSLVGTTLTITATNQVCRVGAQNLEGRQTLVLQNLGRNLVWVGPEGSSPTDGMIKLDRNATLIYSQGQEVNIVARTLSGTSLLVVQESA